MQKHPTFVFDVADTGQMDAINDFSLTDGDQVVFTGLSAARMDASDFLVIERNGSSFVQVSSDEGTVRMVRVMGDSLEPLEIGHLTDDSLISA